MTGGFFHGKGLQKGIIVISNPTSLLDRRDGYSSIFLLTQKSHAFFWTTKKSITYIEINDIFFIFSFSSTLLFK
jgi:hypothetical protein